MTKMSDICRLCLNEAAANKLASDSISYKSQIRLLMPEIDISITPIFILCNRCSDSLNAAYTFKYKCIRNEQLIKNYRKQLRTSMITDLHLVKDQVKDFEKCPSGNEINNYNKIDVNATDINDFIYVSVICNECHGNFNGKEEFEQHKKECGRNKEYDSLLGNGGSQNKRLKLSACRKCNKLFNEDSSLQMHLKIHSEQKQFASDLFALKNKLKESNSPLCRTPEQHTCNVCGKTFTYRGDLKQHENIHKTDVYKCSTCNQSFNTLSHLKQHTANKHSPTFSCEICGYKSRTKYGLLLHTRTHSGERPYNCEICGKNFTRIMTLKMHIRCLHTNERPYVCEKCGKAFAIKSSLRKHKAVHMEFMEKKFACKVAGCDKSFYTAIRLYSHVQRHKAPKKFKCTICDAAFISGSALRRHLMCHTGEKRYKCSLCHKGFTQNSNLKVHLRSHRSKILQNS